MSEEIKLHIAKVIPLETITSLDISAERVLKAALEKKLKSAIIVGEDEDGSLYFASSLADGGAVLWWFEKAKKALMEISE